MKTVIWALLGATLLVLPVASSAFSYEAPGERIITVPAEDSEGVLILLEAGEWKAEVAGGAVTLWYPFHPQHRWLWSVAVGMTGRGGSDAPDLGTLYVDPPDGTITQMDAEREALQALEYGVQGTTLHFTLDWATKVRFWISDFDYTDNSGFVKVRVTRIYDTLPNAAGEL